MSVKYGYVLTCPDDQITDLHLEPAICVYGQGSDGDMDEKNIFGLHVFKGYIPVDFYGDAEKVAELARNLWIISHRHYAVIDGRTCVCELHYTDDIKYVPCIDGIDLFDEPGRFIAQVLTYASLWINYCIAPETESEPSEEENPESLFDFIEKMIRTPGSVNAEDLDSLRNSLTAEDAEKPSSSPDEDIYPDDGDEGMPLASFQAGLIELEDALNAYNKLFQKHTKNSKNQ